MLRFQASAGLHRIVVLNPKGGSGKTTLAFNLAGYLASTGRKVALVDMDRQGSSSHWLRNRISALPRIHSIPARDSSRNATGDQCIVVPEEIDYAVIDAPAGLTGLQLIDYTCGAHAILVPVLPSDLDTHAAARLISDLLLVAQVSRRNGRLGVVANRVNERTIAYQKLKSFLDRLAIAVVGTLRDTQNYVWAAGTGVSIHEMKFHRVRKDLAQWETITQWLERCVAKPLTARDLLRPAEPVTRRTRGIRAALLAPMAAAIALFAVALWWWLAPRDVNNAILLEPDVLAESSLIASPEPYNVVLSDESAAVGASEKLKQKWRLNGVASIDGASVMILSDRRDKTTRRVSTKDDLDGWTVTDSGSDYAVFSQNGEEARLVLNEEAAR